MTPRQHTYLTPFVYGTVLVIGLIVLGSIAKGISAVAPTCFHYNIQDKGKIQRDLSRGVIDQNEADFFLTKLENSESGYFGGCGFGWLIRHPYLMKMETVLLVSYFVVLILVANWLTSLVEGVKRPTGADHVLQTIFFYIFFPVPLVGYLTSIGKPYEDEAGKLLVLAIGLAILIVANALYLGVKRIRWEIRQRSQLSQ